jgi:uncharacterized membrane protein
MNKIFAWMIGSTQFKKWSGVIGGFCLGLWVSANYWREIRATLDVWEISRDQWHGFLLAVVGASGIALSVGLSAAKKRQEKTVSEQQEGGK